MDAFVNSFLLGDCVQVLKTFLENSIDFTLTSPKYDNLRNIYMFVLTKGKPTTFNPIKEETIRSGFYMVVTNKGADVKNNIDCVHLLPSEKCKIVLVAKHFLNKFV